ncbi:MAG: tagaturonate epimerase family protein [Clostridia bacterium]|nr:tagaturonate epimerase family protein [Clostridia bacterium]
MNAPSRAPAGTRLSFGFGDRLGLATPGHLAAIAAFNQKSAAPLFPILAQQSIRELTLTGRTYRDVIADAAQAADMPFGADGDHMKTLAEVANALDCGCTMITVDCSEVLRPEADSTETIYGGAVQHCLDCYELIDGKADFELSVDETTFPTTPAAHFFVANELIKRGVKIDSLAPRFPGSFEKGIDYVGNLAEFEADLIEHQKIAEQFGYRLSIHSGSDKFAVFPIIARVTGGNVHVKTAGTSWLEALRVVAQTDSAFFRELLTFAANNQDRARTLYHVSTNWRGGPECEFSNDDLPALLNRDDIRQSLHITYGAMLAEPLIKQRLFILLRREKEAYINALVKHFKKHLDPFVC